MQWLLLVHYKILSVQLSITSSFHCFVLLLNSITFKYIVSSEEFNKYATCISRFLGSFLIINISSTPLAVYLALLTALLH